MESSPKRRKALNRAGPVLLTVLALVTSGTVAWGHGGLPGSPANSRVHTCVLPVGPLRLPRVVADTDICLPAVETGIDLPQNGTLIGVDIGAPVTTTLAMMPDTRSGPITVSCPAPIPPSHTIIGATVSHSTNASVSTSVRMTDTTWQVTLIAPTGGSKTVVVAPICMRLFQQS